MKRRAASNRIYEKQELVPESSPVLITGGAGFIGTNLAKRYLSSGQRVRIFDNFSRKGISKNYECLKSLYGKLLELHKGDVRDSHAVKEAVHDVSRVFHFAAQVAVTTSVMKPVEDFEINARGTLNVLEAIRACQKPVPVLFTSTNKVYGALHDIPLEMSENRYQPESRQLL
ncbi:MAG: hypothetical protein C5B54_06910, partial [Acidobacteria bacterium]